MGFNADLNSVELLHGTAQVFLLFACDHSCQPHFSPHRCLPMNLTAEDLASGVLRDRVKVGASLADVDPMSLDSSVSVNDNTVKQPYF